MTSSIPQPPDTPPPPPADPPAIPDPAPARTPLSRLAVGIAAFAAGAGIVGAAWAITANSGPDEPATFTLKGTLTLTDDVIAIDGGCGGDYDGGYDDIREGTSVTVYGADGDVVATGELGNSKLGSYKCTFKIAVEGVPKGEKFYKVEVSHRGTLQLTAKEAENGKLVASLG